MLKTEPDQKLVIGRLSNKWILSIFPGTQGPHPKYEPVWKFEKWEVPKKMLPIQSKLFLGGWNRSGVNRWSGGRAMSGKRPGPTRKVRVVPIRLAGYPIFDLAVFGL